MDGGKEIKDKQNASENRIGHNDQRAGSCFRFRLLEKLPHYLLNLCKTWRTVSMRERKLGWTHAVVLAIGLLSYPAFDADSPPSSLVLLSGLIWAALGS